jgi:hypothetical protein
MSAAKARGGKKQKQGVSLPPKPALYTEEECELAHSVPKLLELLSVVEKGSAAKEHREKPLATKQAVRNTCCICPLFTVATLHI